MEDLKVVGVIGGSRGGAEPVFHIEMAAAALSRSSFRLKAVVINSEKSSAFGFGGR